MKTDKQLYTDVIDKLQFEPMIDDSTITVGVHDGVVTVNGFVRSHYEKRAVERAIAGVSGVKAIANELEIKLADAFIRTDADIAKAAIAAIAWHVITPEDKIKVAVENGCIKLYGEVDWWYQRNSAEKAVRNLHGIKGVENNITIKPCVSAIDVKDKIIQEFERNAKIDAQKIEVEIIKDKVILKGEVNSLSESLEANRCVWSVPGVHSVENKLTVAI